MAAVPGDNGVTTPVPAFTAAMPGELVLLHVPPAVAFPRAIVMPTHVGTLPVMAGGSGFTVTVLFAVHPTPSVYVITAVPVATPDTIPPASIVATALLLLHVPPPVAVDSTDVPPTHTLAGPVIAPGNACTVNTRLT